ncbi:MAG: aldo/keto reductase [Flavobacteriaceae bacterium]|nr:aldo/keto reductase [Flavobacteriaceae bacterium]|tara:strand:- start:13986 stop:15023 length:1038 start_codon:yes stop_codon:yes gene_type:complete
MEYRKLPDTDLSVSKICLGTMTWGKQNTISDGFEQIGYALNQGVNFWDTAELYPVPSESNTQGQTEEIIGEWFKKNGKREDIILASKIAGPGDYTSHIRKNISYNKRNIDKAINDSLRRLRTDYIDLYQLHWPERVTNTFGKRGFTYSYNDPWIENFESVLDILKSHIKSGKIRHIGLSNENPWGLMKFIQASKLNRPKMITIQNPYSLLCREFESGNAEICHRENIGLLAYSPLGFGVLSGKYLDRKMPKGSRLHLFPSFRRYNSQKCSEATKLYYNLAKEIGLSLAELSLSFVNERSFVTSTIIGATSLNQLKENIGSNKIKLSMDVLNEIDRIHSLIPNPAV